MGKTLISPKTHWFDLKKDYAIELSKGDLIFLEDDGVWAGGIFYEGDFSHLDWEDANIDNRSDFLTRVNQITYEIKSSQQDRYTEKAIDMMKLGVRFT